MSNRNLVIAALMMMPGLSAGCRSGLGRNGFNELSAVDAERMRSEIKLLLERQVDAWNAGDVEGFMGGYRRDEGLTFLAGGGVTCGWGATLERYRKRYPDRQAMGRLAFSELHINPIAHDAALVWGRWRLERENETGGLFTLLVRRRSGSWGIVHDHTSVGDAH